MEPLLQGGEHALDAEDFYIFFPFRSVTAELVHNILPIYCLDSHLKECLCLLLAKVSSLIFHAQTVDIL